MHYIDGTPVKLGDRVKLFGVDAGVVVASIDTKEYTSDFPAHEWEYLRDGVIVKTANGALVHVESSQAEGLKRL